MNREKIEEYARSAGTNDSPEFAIGTRLCVAGGSYLSAGNKSDNRKTTWSNMYRAARPPRSWAQESAPGAQQQLDAGAGRDVLR